MYIEQEITPARQAAVNGLAVVGFLALIVAGIWLAIYSTRFVPTVVNRISAAAVYLGSVFVPGGNDTTLVVVPNPTASTTISFGNATTTAATTTEPVATTPVKPTPVATNPGAGTNTTVQVSGPVAPSYSGLGDLTVQVTAVGYLTSASSDAFTPSASVPSGERPAVRFTIKNVGTNWSGTWNFTASIPTTRPYTFRSEVQQSLAPGDSIDYTLGFDRPIRGSAQPITITVNPDRTTPESNVNNDEVTVNVNIQ